MFSQMELRVQAYYTVIGGAPDVNLCKAFVPYGCENIFTGEKFDVYNLDHIAIYDNGEWFEENGEPWSPTDLHSVTTLKAFPWLENKDHPEFSHYRRLGKMCNFLKNYQGGIGALMEQLEVSEDIATSLDKGYYESFPNIRKYQDWVSSTLRLQGFVENLYNRRYYLESSSNYYKAGNYLIQGSCADMVKHFQIEVDKLLDDKKSKFIMPVHDELIILIHKDEQYLIPILKELLEASKDVIPNIPMICDVEYSLTSWGNKKNYEGEIIWKDL